MIGNEKLEPALDQLELEKTSKLAAGIVSGDKQALARAISIMESTRTYDRLKADIILSDIYPHCGQTLRLGVSGAPGVGKSTFIEALGLHLVKFGHRVAVLAIDPSSPRSGGSILGDKTRMAKLSRHPNTFIRPSPSKGELGGVTKRTREVIACIDAAGFDILLIETVGVGQSEITIKALADMFILLISPGAGDDLQGIKRGIVELADLIVVNKADGDFKTIADRTLHDYMKALLLTDPSQKTWQTKIVKCSSLEGHGIEEIWPIVEDFQNMTHGKIFTDEYIESQSKKLVSDEIMEALLLELQSNPDMCVKLEEIEKSVREKVNTPSQAAREILQLFTKQNS